MKRTTVLITGATGSIGRKLRTHFTAIGGVDLRLLCINPEHDPDVITADLSEYDDAWARHFKDADAIIHLAGASSARSTWPVVQKLNIDMSLNVFRAAERHHARKIVFASSNWILAGYRFGNQALTTDMAPCPVNPYGASKLFVERAGRDLAARTGIAFLGLRIGYCQNAPGNIPGPHMELGMWGQQMWLSDRDLCNAMERAVLSEALPFAILNVMSDNPGMRWDIDTTRRLIGYQPLDRHLAVSTPDIEQADRLAAAQYQAALNFP
jgi:nucleoside-diphosphate-sugar epimerase